MIDRDWGGGLCENDKRDYGERERCCWGSFLTPTYVLTRAWGRDYSDGAPVKGVFMGGGTHTLTVEVDVARLE